MKIVNSMKIKRACPSKPWRRRGFTLIEMLVVLFIFSAVVVIGLSAVITTYVVGRTHSSETADINRELNLIFETISQKMANANADATINFSGTSADIKKFGVGNGNILTIVSEGTPKQCTFFYRNADKNTLNMIQEDCDGAVTPADFDDKKITSVDIKITEFLLTPGGGGTPPTSAPWITVQIKAQDIKGEITTTVKSSYGEVI